MAVIVENNEIWLTGTVGAYWWDDGFTAVDVAFALAQIGRSTDIVVHLNSGGGLASEGAAIHSQFAAHKGRVEIFVEGIAASAASIVAMAADRLVMSLGATLMIHDPAVMTSGTIADHLKSIDYLTALAASYADIYAEKTGKPVEEMRALMAAETWMTAEEAVASGFADATTAASPRAANDNQPTAFAYRAYAHAPAALTALADARGWRPLPHPAVAPTARATTPPPSPAAPSIEDPTMTEKTPTADPAASAAAASEAVAAAKTRIKAITTAEAAVGREALAAHLAYETEMTAEAAVAALEAAPKSVAAGDANAYAARRAAAAALAVPGGGGGAPKAPTASLDPRAVFAKRAAARAARP